MPKTEQPERSPEEVAAFERHERIIAGIDGDRAIVCGGGDGHRADLETRLREEARWKAMSPEERYAEERERKAKWDAIWKKQHPELFDANGHWKGRPQKKRTS